MAEQAGGEIQMDGANLYREETYTDLKAGTLRKLVPVTAAGADDPARKPIYSAATQVMTPGGYGSAPSSAIRPRASESGISSQFPRTSS